MSIVAPEELARALDAFAVRLRIWRDNFDRVRGDGSPVISVETPVFKGGWLIPAIESVLYQTSTRWSFTARWDGGDELSRRILEIVAQLDHPRLRVFFGENRGIAYTRRYITEHAGGEYLVSLDDDDMLATTAVERFLACVLDRPWSGIVRAKREFIDAVGRPVASDPWFPFEARHYQHGMVTDLFNHSQPALISRAAYDKATGWEGFEEFMFAGADCDIFTKVEEVAPIELLDEVLYYYRLHDRRTSLVIKDSAAFAMWRRLADKTIARIGLPLRRVSDRPPFRYEHVPRPVLSVNAVGVVVISGGHDAAAVERTRRAIDRGGIGEDAVTVVPAGTCPAASRNTGYRACSRPVVCFLDAGVEIDGPAALDSWLSAMDAPGVGLSGPSTMEGASGTSVIVTGFGETNQPVLASAAPAPISQGGVRPVGWLTSTALMVRREVLAAVGGFDEAFDVSWWADADFSMRARQRDFGCIVVGGVRVSGVETAPIPPTAGDRHRFAGKWKPYPGLFTTSRAEDATA